MHLLRAALVAVAVTVAACSAPQPPAPTPPAPPAPALPVSIYTHCGLEFAKFEDRWWQTSPRPAPPEPLNPDGTITVDGYTNGTMTRLGSDLLRFDWSGGSAEFRPAAQPPKPCQ